MHRDLDEVLGDRLDEVCENDDAAAFEQLMDGLSLHEFAEHALLVAARTGAVTVVRWMMDRGASLDIPSTRGSLVDAVCTFGHPHVLALLLEAGAPVRGVPLVKAAHCGPLESVRLLVEAGVDVNQGYRGFPTPLRAAMDGGHADIVAYLQLHGATKLVGDGSGVGK
ncbi:MAG: ankyrin repeat domain-containing protein [Sandaracinus sp.]|nr:ankyrin repeat domain-containing protein [Sandaracinus sp.]MCB9636160.1 ankyrin repeat domain-containing protein [Sandaracinus sp.]